MLRVMVEGTASVTGDEFFRSLVSNLASALRVRYAFVSEFTVARTRVRTLAFWAGNSFLDNFEYDLAGTPCEQVLRGQICHYPEGVQVLFPKDKDLVKLRAESYLAIPLTAPEGKVLGHLAALDDKAMPGEFQDMSILKIFAGRASAELQRKRAEETVRKSEDHLRKIFDHSNDAIFVIDPARDIILDANPMACHMLGFTREELLLTPITAIHPDEMPELLAFARSVFARGHGWTNELTCRTKSGKTLPAEISGSVMEMPSGTCMLALVRDITERKQAEMALRESEERFARILESAMDAIITIDQEQRIVLFNVAAEKVFRVPGAGVIGQSFTRFLSKRSGDVLAQYMGATEQRSERRAYIWAPESLTARRSEGEEFPAEATISQVVVGGRKLFTIILRDIHERQRVEAELAKVQLQKVYLQEELATEHHFEEFVGDSTPIQQVFEQVQRVSGTEATVFLTGETGTGKELIARRIHKQSRRKDKVLIKVNCAALPGGLVESELFGHEKGAFTGALARKLGRFELADGGTIFLDEIGELPLDLQPKLLRVLQEGEFERVGGSHTFKVNVRVIAATNRDPEQAMKAGLLRADLFYRLNVFPIRLPSLRERKEDIPLLVKYFTWKKGTRLGKKIETIPERVMHTLMHNTWPGNIRELEHVIERAVILSDSSQLELGDWLVKPSQGAGPSRIESLEEVEHRHILSTLEATGWVVSGEKGAAQILGLKRTTLEARMKKLGISRTS